MEETALIELFVNLFANLDTETQRQIVGELDRVIVATEKIGFHGIDAAERVGAQGIDAAKAVVQDAIKSIESSVKTVSGNMADVIKNGQDRNAEVKKFQIYYDGRPTELKWDTLKEVVLKSGSPQDVLKAIEIEAKKEIAIQQIKEDTSRARRKDLLDAAAKLSEPLRRMIFGGVFGGLIR